MTYAGTTVLAGAAAFRLAISSRHRLDDPASVRMVRVAGSAMPAGSALRLVVQVADASGRSITDAISLLGDAVDDTRAGRLDAIRVGLALAALAVAALWRHAATTIVGLIIAVATLITLAMSGHAWTVERRWRAVVVDTIHQAGAAVWVGGLAAVVIGLTRTRGPVHWAARRFSQLALGAVAVLAVTGLARPGGRPPATSKPSPPAATAPS